MRMPARSMDIPAVVGARLASHLIRQDDWVIVDGDVGVVIVDPSAIVLAEYGFRQRQGEIDRGRLVRLLHTPAITLDGQKVELLANIEMPDDAAAAIQAGAVGVGLFRSEFLFMGRNGKLPDEEEQYLAYRRALEGMQGLPVTIRTVDGGIIRDKRFAAEHYDFGNNPPLPAEVEERSADHGWGHGPAGSRLLRSSGTDHQVPSRPVVTVHRLGSGGLPARPLPAACSHLRR